MTTPLNKWEESAESLTLEDLQEARRRLSDADAINERLRKSINEHFSRQVHEVYYVSSSFDYAPAWPAWWIHA